MKKLNYDVSVRTLQGKEGDLQAYEGKVMLIVNTASKCGLTPQYKGLEKLHQDFQDKGLAILGFPCNQFGKQEPGNSSDITEFCQINYGVSFQMFEKIDVNGAKTHALYKQLKSAKPGLLGSKSIKWNFTKFLVGKNGKILTRYAPKTEPDAIRKDIETHLKA